MVRSRAFSASDLGIPHAAATRATAPASLEEHSQGSPISMVSAASAYQHARLDENAALIHRQGSASHASRLIGQYNN